MVLDLIDRMFQRVHGLNPAVQTDPTCRWYSIRFFFIASLVSTQFTVGWAQVVQQTLPLERGWNLVAVQVDPLTPDPAQLFGAVPGLVSVWSFNNVSKQWNGYRSPNFDAEAIEKNALKGVAIESVSLGQALWIEMDVSGTLTLSGLKPLISPPVSLTEGWNLIGVPVTGPEGNHSLEEAIPMVSVLALNGLDFDVLLKWQEGASLPPGVDAASIAYNISRFGTVEEGTINEEQFNLFNPDRGYWVRVTAPKTIQPELLTTVRGDADLPPLGNFPKGPEDLVISGEPIPVRAAEQRSIVFFEDQDVQRVSFSNQGGGVMLWEAIWERDDLTSPEWISLSQERTSPGNETRLTGVTTTEQETFYLRLDRANLTRGSYSGKLTLRTSGGDRVFAVRADVGGLKGEWKGFAEVQTVNGKRNRVPDIDLALSFFEDRETPGLLRGAIDSSQTVVWPSDVQLLGYITSADGNALQLGGALVLPPGDQNNEPYDEFDASPSGNDVDWNDDGFNAQDRKNPFPFPIYRSVSLEGGLVKASPIDGEGYEIAGRYREVVYGMLEDPIELLGTFTLQRESPIPFNGLRSQEVRPAGQSVFSPVATGPSPGRRLIAHGGSTPAVPPVVISADLVLEDIEVAFSIKGSSEPVLPSSNLTIQLESPGGKRMTLHDGSRVEPSLFVDASYPSAMTPLGTDPSWSEYVASIERTSGEWRLIIVNNSGSTIDVSNVRIQLVGQPLIDVYGRVQNSDGSGVPGVDISVSGLPYSLILPSASNADGGFVFEGIPAMPLNISAFHPAYEGGASLDVEQLVPDYDQSIENSEELRLRNAFASRPLPAAPPGALGIGGFSVAGSSITNPFDLSIRAKGGEPRIFVFPARATPGQPIEFHAIGDFDSGSYVWDFGDARDIDSGRSVVHSYNVPGQHTVMLVAGSTTLTTSVIVEQVPGVATIHAREIDPGLDSRMLDYDAYIVNAAFAGGGALPADWETQVQNFEADAPATPVELVMVQQAYAASADIDLAPKVGADNSFSTDGFTTGPINLWRSNRNEQPTPGPGLSGIPSEGAADETPAPTNDPGWTYEDHNYVLGPGKWFDDRNLNGRLDPGEDDLAGVTGYLYNGPGDNDTQFEGPRPTGLPNSQIEHFKIACHIGSFVVAPGVNGASVHPVDVDPVKAPTLEPGNPKGGVARNLHYQLQTNPFAVYAAP